MKQCGLVTLLMASALTLGGCRSRGADSLPLVCHVGGTMRPVLQQLARLFEEQTGQKVEINSAGSGELLAHIEGQRLGDLYVCHDPFLDILMQKYEMGVDGWVIAELTPVIVVAKGNPKGIGGLKDLTRPDVSLALTDYTRSTLGRMLKTIFSKADVDFEQLNRDKKITIHKSGGYVANLVVTGNADAAMCWRAVAALRTDGLDVVELPVQHLPIPEVDAVTSATGKDYPLTPVRVTIATLTCASQPERAAEFAEFLTSERTAIVLKEHGFTMSGRRKLYQAGQALPVAPMPLDGSS
jgi:molybdate transport system substrate-binding protein